jgi:hypothetical protein
VTDFAAALDHVLPAEPPPPSTELPPTTAVDVSEGVSTQIEAGAGAVLPTEKPSPFSAALDEVMQGEDEKRQRNQQVRSNILYAANSNPDLVAKSYELGKRVGLPAETVERNYPRIEAEAKADQWGEPKTLGTVLHEWIADPTNAKMVIDDLAAMQGIERSAKKAGGYASNQKLEKDQYVVGGILSGVESIGQGFNDVSRVNNLNKLATFDRFDKGEAVPATEDPEGYGDMSPAQRAETRTRVMAQIAKSTILNMRSSEYQRDLPRSDKVQPLMSALDAIAFDKDFLRNTTTAIERFIEAPGEIMLQLSADSIAFMIPTIAGQLVAGPVGAFVLGAPMDYSARFSDILKDEMTKIVSSDDQFMAGGFDPNDEVEKLRFMQQHPELMKKAQGSAWLGAVVTSTADAVVFGMAGGLKKGAGVRKNATVFARNLGREVASEGVQEATARAVAGQDWSTSEVVSEMLGAGPMAVAGTVKSSVSEYVADIQNRAQEVVLREVGANIVAATELVTTLQTHVAEQGALTIDDLIDKVQASKLNERSPDKMREFLETVLGGDKEQTVFVPPNVVATYMQDQTGLERVAFLEKLGITEQQIERARVSKEDIAIPLPDYVMNVGEAHKAWRDDIRTEVEGFSVNQAKDYEKTRTAETQAIIQRFEEGLAAGVQLEPRQIVQDKVFTQLKEMGLPTRQAASNAALLAGHANAMATLEPTKYADALDFYEKHPIRFESENTRRVRELAPDRLDILLESIRSGKDPLSPPVPDAHVKARADAAALELTSVLGPGPEKTPAQIAKENRKAAQELFKADRENLAGMLAEMGVDPKGMSNDAIRSALEGAASGQGRTYNEAGVPKQSLSDSLIMVAQRGDRTVGNRLLLSPAEKAAIKASTGPANMSEREITETVRKHKLAHPPAQGWEPLVFVRARLDDKGKPEFQYQQVPYGFIKGNDGKEIQPDDKRYAARVKAIGDAMAEEVRSVYRRAQAGDKNAQNILAQAGWYKAMRTRLRQEFGALGDLFADALGATSPNTPVRGNWENAIDSLRLASRGDFDALIPKWVAWAENVENLETDLRAFVNEQRAKKQASKIEPWMDSDKPQTLKSIKEMQEYLDKRKALSEARELPEDLMPKKESGAKYGFNGKNVVRAMLDMWRTIKDADPDVGRGGTAPKALNFSGNLIGFRGKATIDVWAARLLQRLAGKRRIPSMAEATVSGEMLSDASTTKQFGFGQAAFDHAVDVIRGDGEMKQDNALATINADDLQAVVWFIEKEVWTVNNWTSVAGEGGSFELEANLTGTAKQDRVRELRKTIDSSPATADTRAVAASAEATAAVEAWDAEHKSQIDELGEINRRLAEEAGTLSKKDASGLKKRAAELQKIIKLPAKLAKPMRDAQNGQRRIDELAASKIAARAELSSLERTVDRYVGGLSTQMSIDNQGVDYVPTDADMARLGQEIRLAIYENDANANVLASKALATEGRYGSVERSLDLEIVAREGYDPSTVWAEMLRQAQAARQDSTFLSRVLRDGEAIDYTKHRPGIEIYFRDAAAAQQLEKMLADLAKEGVSFLTVAVDGRRMPGYVAGAMPPAVGVRLQYVPEFEQRYGIDDLLGLDDEALSAKIRSKGDELDAVADAVSANVPGVSFSGVFWHETQVAFSHQYQEKIDALATGRTEAEAGSSAGSEQWRGNPVRAGLENADRQYREAASREPDVQREPVVGGDETGPGANQQGVTLDQPAYHGGPHIFNRFSLDAIGTGEGAQAYGWGLYFASNRAVAEYYRKALAGDGALEFGGVVYNPDDGSFQLDVLNDVRNIGIDATRAELLDQKEMRLADIDEAEARNQGYGIDGLEDKIADIEESLAFLDSIKSADDIKEVKSGRLYTVEIPEDGAYLLWDKPLSEQTPEVQKAVAKLFEGHADFSDDPNDRLIELADSTGKEIYQQLADDRGGQKTASLALREAGIPGIKYLDGSSRSKGDGDYNFVLFDDSLAEITAYEQEARGSITFDNTGALVRTFAGRDPSTVLHELWHYFHNNLEFMARAPDASPEVKAMYQATLDYAGVKGGNLSLTPAEWDRYRTLGDKIKKSGKKSLDGGETAEWTVLLGRVEQNEVVARAGEAFLLTGKSPSEALASAFRAFKNWLITVYRSVKRLNVPVSAEFDAVMAQMIATREEIEAAQNRQGLNPVLGDAKNMLSEAERDAYTKRAEQVLDEADDKVRAKVMAPLRRAAKSLVDDVTSRIKGEVTAEAMKDPGNAALYLLRNGKLFDSSTAGTPAQIEEATKAVETAEVAVRMFSRGNGTNTPERAQELLSGAQATLATAQARLTALSGAKSPPVKPLPIKLSRPALVALVGEDGLKNLPTGIHAEDGMDPTTVAQMVGLGNGQELVERLMQVQTDQKRHQDDGGKGRAVDDQIHRETHRRVLEEIGDPLNDGSLEKEVEDAIRSDKQGALMAFELKILARKAGHSGVVSLEDITAWADGAIAEMSQYQAVQFAKYQRAERTAGIKVQQALLKGDIVAAFKAKQDQLVNFALYKAAKRAAEDTDKITGYLDKLAGARTIKALDQDYLDTIHEMLEEYDFKRRSGTLLAERTRFNAYKAEQLERGVVVQEPPRLKGAERKHFSQMSMEELRDFYDTIKQIDRLGRKKKELFLDGKKRELEATLTEMEAAAAAGVQRGSSLSTRGLSDLEKAVGKPKHWLRVMNAELLKVERLLEFADGDKTGRGIFTRMIYRPIADAAAATNDRRVELGKKQKAIYEKVPEAQRHSWAELHVLPELGGIKLDKEAIIAIALNMGNASNLEKMLLGEKWSEDGVRAVVNKHLTKEEWTFVQDMWDLIDSQWPEAAAMIRDVEGVEPPKIEAVPLQTPYGTLKGGYYPVEYARNEGLKGDKVGEMQDSALLVGMAPSPRYGRPSSKAGSTNARTEFNAPFNLSLSVIGKHLDEITHDIFHRRAVADIFKIVSNDRFREAIRSRLGAEYEKVFMPWLKRVANEARQNNSDLRGWDSAMKTLRVNVTMMAMGLRVSTMVQQVAGYANSLQRLGSKDMLSGMAEFWPNPGRAAEQVYALSGEMRHRANNLERDVKANLDKFRGKSTWKASLGRFAFRGIALADLSVSIPTWLGAYRKGLADGFNDADAIAYADKMVRDTQGAGGSKDLSSFQDGSETWKIMGMFYSFLNVFYNAQQGIVEDARKPGKSFSDYADIAWQASMLMIVSPILAALLSGQGPDDEEDKLYWAMRQAGFGAFSGIPIVRDLMGTLSREMGGKPSAGFKMSPVAGPLEGSIRLVKDLTNLASGEEVSKNFVKNTFNVVGGFAGLPTGQIGVTSQFLWDSLISGAENPENLLDWMRGMSFGPKK